MIIYLRFLLGFIFIFGAFSANAQENNSEVERIVRSAISTIPDSDLRPVYREFSTQNGRCTVGVTETLEPLEPIISDGRITYPYKISRPDHRYNCTGNPLSGPFTAGPQNADIRSTVTADYTYSNGRLSITNIVDQGKNGETAGAVGIVATLSNF